MAAGALALRLAHRFLLRNGGHESSVPRGRPLVDECQLELVSASRHIRKAASETASRECPRPESNQCTRFRKPLLYPLSYGGSARRVAPQRDRKRRAPVPSRCVRV